MRRLLNRLVWAALIGTAACGVESPLDLERLAEAETAVEAQSETLQVSLVSPVAGARVAQNDPSIGCPAHPARGYGFRLVLDWDDVQHSSGIERYEVFAQHQGSLYPIADTPTNHSQFVHLSCNGFVIDSNLDDWQWRVRAVAGDGTIGPWSEGEFAFEPCRLAAGGPCFAPPRR